MAHILFGNSNIEFEVKGNQGKVVVLLHGYLESLMVWENFANELKINYTVVLIDLPGHGNSSIIENCTINTMSLSVNAVLEHLRIDKCTMIGHSMGGYVTLEFFANYPEKLDGYCLFHSSPFADSQEKKNNRQQTIEQINNGQHISLAKAHVEKTFSKKNLEKFVQEIGFLKVIAVNTKADGAIMALKAMKERTDYTELYENTQIKTLWIFGSEDNFISKDIIKNVNKPQNGQIAVIEGVGHQGYIEDVEKSKQIIEGFLVK